MIGCLGGFCEASGDQPDLAVIDDLVTTGIDAGHGCVLEAFEPFDGIVEVCQFI